MSDTPNQPADDSTKNNGQSVRMRRGGLYQRPGSPVYYARWTINGKVFKVSTGKTKKRDAEIRLAELMRPYLLVDEQGLAKSVSNYIADAETTLHKIEEDAKPELRIANAWMAYINAINRPDAGQATLRQYECQFTIFDTWAGEQKPPIRIMREVTEEIATSFVRNLVAEKRTANTINKYLNLLQLVWRVLAKPARLTVNPWVDIQRKKLDPVTRREMTLEELKAICGAATGELATLLALGLFTGMRMGDCCTLRWGETDLVRGIILKDTRKTGKAVQIPIHPELLALLKSAEESKAGEYVLPDYSAAYLRRSQTVVSRIQKHFADCGIATAAPVAAHRSRRGVEVGFHSLRHSFVSLCARAGVPLAAVQSIVGHSNPSMTRHYSHMGLESARGAVAALPCLMTGTDTKPSPTPADTLKMILGIVKDMNADNWEEQQKKIIGIIGEVSP